MGESTAIVSSFKQSLSRFWPMSRPRLQRLLESPMWAMVRSNAESRKGLSPEVASATRSTLTWIQVMSTVLLLPLRNLPRDLLHTLGQAYEALIGSENLTIFMERLRRLCSTLEEFASASLTVYRSEVDALGKRAVLLERAGPDSGMDPFVAAVAAIAHDSQLVSGFYEVRQAFDKLTDQAESLLKARESSAGIDLVRLLVAVVKATELARYYGSFLREPVRRVPLGDFVPLHYEGNLLDRLNQVYYCLRGVDIYQDFVTVAYEDSCLAQADAISFYHYLNSFELHHRSGPITVLEVGGGDGTFAGDFLNEIMRQDALALSSGALNQRIYDSVQYTLADISDSMLIGALNNPSLAQHRNHLKTLEIPKLTTVGPLFHLQRFHELFSDLTCCALLYIDRAGCIYSAEVRGTFPSGKLPRLHNGTPIELTTLSQWISGVDLESLKLLQNGELERIGWEVRFRPVSPSGIPYYEFIPSILRDARDILIPFNIGAARFLEECISRAVSRGLVRVFDYGFSDVSESVAEYTSASQLVRQFGAHFTRDLNFPLLVSVARRVGCRARLSRQEDMLSESFGIRPLHYRPLAGLQGKVSLSRLCSGPKAPLPLECLRAYRKIVQLAKSLENSGSCYADFIKSLEEKGWVVGILPTYPSVHVEGLLAQLAVDLDFAISAACLEASLSALQEKRIWLDNPELLEQVFHNLETLGYASEAVNRLFEVSDFSKLWVLEVTKG